LIVGIAFLHPSLGKPVPQSSFRRFVHANLAIPKRQIQHEPILVFWAVPGTGGPTVGQAFALSNAQYGGAPSAPGAVGTHPFQTTALRKRRAIIT
jgi:hypothetical protein